MKKNNYTLAMKDLIVLYDKFKQIKRRMRPEETNESFLEKASVLKEQVSICKNSLDAEFDYFLNSFESIDQRRENRHKLHLLSVDEQFDAIKSQSYVYDVHYKERYVRDDFNISGRVTKAKIIEWEAALFVLEDLEEVYIDNFMKLNGKYFEEKPKKILCYVNFDTSEEYCNLSEGWAKHFREGAVHSDFLNSEVTIVGQLIDCNIVQVSTFLNHHYKFDWPNKITS